MPPNAVVYLLMLSVSLLWGLAFVGIKEALDHMSPATLTILRFAVADAAILLLALVWRGARPARFKGDEWRIGVLALLGIPVYHLAITWGEHRTSASVAALIVGTAPVMVAVLSALVLRESVSTRRAAGIALAFAGVVVLAMKGSPAADGRPTQLSGVLVALLSPASWAVYTVVGRSILPRVKAMRLTATTFLVGGVMLLPFVRAETLREIAALPAEAWAWTIFLGLGSSVAGYLIFNLALSMVEAAKIAVFIYMVPVVAVLSAALLLGEPLTAWVALAAAMVVGGVVITERDQRRARLESARRAGRESSAV
ncbi:MAG TPA: DMT family transporter [Actinomycetota bacterium]|nr:DMT family transporter [Actinomycetota bacterium]